MCPQVLRNMPEYQSLSDDELLHLGEESDQLTEEARLEFETELSRRKLSLRDIDSYRSQREAAETSDALKHARPKFVHNSGVGQMFLGKTNRRPDPSGLFEEYESTLWFVIFWFPVFPIASYTVRQDFNRWLGFRWAGGEVSVERHPRNWEQILLTWVKAGAVLLLLRLAFLLLSRHPEWLRHIA
jgi:hypothetical protein